MTIVMVEKNAIKLCQGSWTFCIIHVHYRHNYDGGKRARNTAVRVDVKSLPYSNDNRTETVSGSSFSVGEALKLLDSLDISTAPFINVCKIMGWAAELPTENGQGVLL